MTVQQALQFALRQHEAGRIDDAERIYRQIIAQHPNNDVALHFLGALVGDSGRVEEGVELTSRAIAINPTVAAYYSNLGEFQRRLGRLPEALAAAQRGVELKPQSPQGHFNLAVAHQLGGDFPNAIAEYRRAIELKPDYVKAHVSLAMLLLSTGNFAEGWEEFEWRLKYQETGLRRDFVPPQWNGEDVTGKTLLLHTEGGYGDAFHFVRYVPLLRGRAKKIILECQPILLKLFSDLLGADSVIAREHGLQPFDYQIPLQSLPRVFKTDLTNIPSEVPYLKVPRDCRLRWKERVQKDGRLNVGLVWAGSPRQKVTDDLRTRGLDVFAPLATIPNVRFFSLQKSSESSLPRPPGLELTDFTADLDDFVDTAALIENLDLVISVDTSVAHLAGALGKPVWVLIPYLPDFRWLIDRTDSPWYPTMRLFRQKRRRDWTTVITEVAGVLAEIARADSISSP